jgi:hypothetical protein
LKEETERDLQLLGVRRWREMVIDEKKLKDITRLDKAKFTACCSGNGG